MGIPGQQRRTSIAAGDRRGGLSGKFITIAPVIILGLAGFVVALNLRMLGEGRMSNCDEEGARNEYLDRLAMERKIETLQNELFKNSIFVSQVLEGLDKAFQASERLSVDDIRMLATTEATQISRRRESKPPPPFSEYAKSRVKEAIGSGSLQEVVESSLFPGDDAIYDFPSGGGGNPIDAGWDWTSQASVDDTFLDVKEVKTNALAELLSEEDRERQCRKWLTQHKVMPGIDWGSLPIEDQMKWSAYSCDAFVHDA